MNSTTAGNQTRPYFPAPDRAGPIFQGRALGLDPDAGDGVWSPSLFEACLRGPCPPFPVDTLAQIGADMATGKEEDYFALRCRWGNVSVHYRTSNTMDPVRIGAALKEAAAAMSALVNTRRSPHASPTKPQQIPMKLDDDGTGNAVGSFLRNEGYTVQMIGAGTKPRQPDKYPNTRSELWFATADRARSGGVYFLPQGVLPGLGLDRQTLQRLKQQLLAPAWEMDSQGKRRVEPKEKTKEKIGRGPDDGDATNLSYFEPSSSKYEAHAKKEPDYDPRGGRACNQRSVAITDTDRFNMTVPRQFRAATTASAAGLPTSAIDEVRITAP